MLRESNLLHDLQQNRFNSTGEPLCLYGDPVYPLSVHLLSPFFKRANLNQQQKDLNSAMSSACEAVEWDFSKVLNYFAFVDFKKNLNIKCSWLNIYGGGIAYKCTHMVVWVTNRYFFKAEPLISENYF